MNADEHFRRWLTTISIWRLAELRYYGLSAYPPSGLWTTRNLIIARELDFRLNTLIEEEFDRRRVEDLTQVEY